MMEPAAFTLDDPRPIAEEAPYTFFLPAPARLAAFGVGDLVQVTFRPTISGTKWDAERMWVRVTSTSDEGCRGQLETQPDDMPGLSAGDEVAFQRWHALKIVFDDPENDVRFPHSDAREYWDRCLVDQCVLNGEKLVGYIYREAPDPALACSNDPYPDSGWRIRGDLRGCSHEEVGDREVAYVALGAVLNLDDSWLHLIDEPVGSGFDRDLDLDVYVAESS